MIAFFAFVAKIGLGGFVNRAIGLLEQKAELEGNQDKLRTQVTIEAMRSAVDETRIMANLTKSKMTYQIFWYFLALFIVPLGIWWAAVIADSLFHWEWNVAALPHPLDLWAGDMIKWLFYVGSGVGSIAAVKGIFSR